MVANCCSEFFETDELDDLQDRIEELEQREQFNTSMHLHDLVVTAAIFGCVGVVVGLVIGANW